MTGDEQNFSWPRNSFVFLDESLQFNKYLNIDIWIVILDLLISYSFLGIGEHLSKSLKVKMYSNCRLFWSHLFCEFQNELPLCWWNLSFYALKNSYNHCMSKSNLGIRKKWNCTFMLFELLLGFFQFLLKRIPLLIKIIYIFQALGFCTKFV